VTVTEAVEEVAARCVEKGVRIALAESLTSGLIASRIGSGPNASEWFAGGVVAYQTDVKERLLGLRPGTDPTSAACARALAEGARSLFDTDLAVSATGVGGPDVDDGHAPGTVYLGWATRADAGDVLLRFTGDPESVLDQTADAAVELARDLLRGDVGGL
jgi:nicotinamide-nucleotide amidase